MTSSSNFPLSTSSDPGYTSNLPEFDWSKAAISLAWLYCQSNGRLYAPDEPRVAGASIKDYTLVAIGYSGHDSGLNNTSAEAIPNTGPIPRGIYLISRAFTHPKLGPLTMRLSPYGNTNTFGRGGFCIHGDNMELNHTASEGCIILNRPARQSIASSVTTLLQVY